MVYAVISEIKFGEGFGDPATGSMRLVNMGDIPQPADFRNDPNAPIFCSMYYFSNYKDAKDRFDHEKRDLIKGGHLVEFFEETQDYNPLSPDEEKAYYDKKKREQEEYAKRAAEEKKAREKKAAAEKKAQEEKEAAERAVKEKKAAERAAAEKRAREAQEAAERLREAAEQGDADAQFNLGRSYFTGQGETQEYAKAVEWFGKAAAQGHVEAKDWLAKAEAAMEKEAKEKARWAAEKAAEAKKAAKEAAKRAARNRRPIIGLVLEIGVSVAYLSVLWGTDIVNSLWLTVAFLRLLPLAAFSFVVGIIYVVFRLGDDYTAESFILLIMIIVQAITASVWMGNVGFLFTILIGRAVLNIISTILGLIFPYLFSFLRILVWKH